MKSIRELFEAQVERTPDSVALRFGDSRLTYRELDRRADALARQLGALGVGPNVLVALFLERSLDMIVGMLGVLKAGGAYVPLDPAHPRKRLAYMLADAQPLVLLTQGRLQSAAPPHGSHLVVIDAEPLTAARTDAPPAPNEASSPRDLAYVIYTSGSTGEPKGVEIENGAVANMLASMRRRPGLGAEDTMLAITTVAFDIAVLEIFLPLICGACVVIAPSEAVVDGAALIDLLERSGASIMQATPATWRMLLDAGWAGAPHLKLLCGGEAWTAELASELLPRCGSLWNMYGPTETTVWSAVAKVEAGRPVMIGPPIANTRLYVLDGGLQLVPVGVPGELHIGGAGLARGYLNRPQLTNERFVTDPFAAAPRARMYRTGDLVRRLPDGALEFMGRLDHQVKIRGHRVELGEIEAALERHPGIQRCVVVAGEDAHGGQRLIAYTIPAVGPAVGPASGPGPAVGPAVPAGELRLLLAETLPAYMIPTAFVSVVAFPLSPSGKLDRNALPPPDTSAPETDVASIEPRTSTEKVLARIWCEMLDLKRVGVRDDFFDLGGHSLLATRVIGRINQTLEVRLRVPAFFENPTIEGLAKVLEQKQHIRPEPQLLPLRSGRTGVPLYFIGAGPTETQIARLMGEDRAIFAIDIPMPVAWRQAIAASNSAALPTIEELGALYSDLLRTHAGSSPCVVAGYSLWGKIAFEAARELQRAGGDVAFVLLLDARALNWGGATRGAGAQSWRWIWRGGVDGAAGDVPYPKRLGAKLADSWRLFWWLLSRAPQAVKNRLSPETRLSGYFDKNGVPIGQTVINRMTRIVGKSFQPHPLDASGVLVRARFPGEDKLPGYDFNNGWTELFDRGLQIVQATGDHVSMVREDNVGALAQLVDEVLERYDMAKETPRRELSRLA